jgi:ketosteroid isomerase-like protein
MATEPTTQRALEQLGQDWSAAERASDAERLETLLTDDFTCVGPLGFVLNKGQYLHGRRAGDLLHTAFDWSDVQTRVYDDTAIAVGTQTQSSTYQGNDASGRFRVTQVMLRNGSDWRIASLHYSPIAQPPGR